MAWTVQQADVAERIMRREWERLLGFYFVEYHAFPLIHRYVQAMSLDKCQAIDGGDWRKFAAFSNFTARLSQQETSSLLTAIESGDCEAYTDLSKQLLENAPSLIVDDEWYGAGAENLPEHGPYWATPLGDARTPEQEDQFSWTEVIGGAAVGAIVFYTIGKILK